MKLFYDMTVIREMETEAKNLYQKKLIKGFCHLYIGQVRQRREKEHRSTERETERGRQRAIGFVMLST